MFRHAFMPTYYLSLPAFYSLALALSFIMSHLCPFFQLKYGSLYIVCPGDLLNLDVNFQASPEERDIKGT